MSDNDYLPPVPDPDPTTDAPASDGHLTDAHLIEAAGDEAVAGEVQPATEGATPQRPMSPLVAGGIGVLVGAGLSLGIAIPLLSDDGAGTEAFAAAVDECGNPSGVAVTDSGATLVFDHKGEDEYTGADLDDVACVLHELELPSRIASHMDQTTSIDGRQTEQWDNFEIQWSYHPDRGMDGMVYVVEG